MDLYMLYVLTLALSSNLSNYMYSYRLLIKLYIVIPFEYCRYLATLVLLFWLKRKTIAMTNLQHNYSYTCGNIQRKMLYFIMVCCLNITDMAASVYNRVVKDQHLKFSTPKVSERWRFPYSRYTAVSALCMHWNCSSLCPLQCAVLMSRLVLWNAFLHS